MVWFWKIKSYTFYVVPNCCRRERVKAFFKLIFRSKTVLANFWEFKKILKKLLTSYFCIGDCSLMYKEGFCKFSQQNVENFWKLKFWLACNARGEICQFFGNWPPKNIPDQQKCVAFRKSQKVLNHSTLLHTYDMNYSQPALSFWINWYSLQ